MNEITISSEHIYRVDGVPVESVTQAIGRAGLDPNAGFYNKEGAKRGTDVHVMLEHYDLMTLNLQTVRKEYIGYLKAYNLFCRMTLPHWDLDGIEQTFYSETFNFCGTRDRVGSILWKNQRVKCVLDLKTGVKTSWHGIQLAGYTLDHRYDRERFGLYLKDNGTYSLQHYTDDGEFDTFINILKGE